MNNNSFFKQILFLAIVVFLASCDKDYNVIGVDLIGGNHFKLDSKDYSVLAYNQKIGSVQSSGLPINALGIYDNPAFGTTTANFATQVSLSSLAPAIGANPVIQSVVLTVPYFSTLKSRDAAGSGVFELDSIYGPSNAKIKLSVYESGYFMRDLDPLTGFQERQKFFTDQNTDFDNLKGVLLNDDANKVQNDEFVFSEAEYSEKTTGTDGKEVITRTAPGMRLNLNASFFDAKILKAPASKLATMDAFKDYFRGLYFKVEKSGSNPAALGMMNFSAGKISVKYKEDLVTTTMINGVSTTTTTRVDKEIVLNMTGNAASLQAVTNSNGSYTAAVNSPNASLGDEKLYLKGGEGSMAVIELFKTPGELEAIRNSGWLINEANLIFNIDADAMKDSYEPNRIYLYDLTNNTPIVDYFADPSMNNAVPKRAKTIFDGLLNKQTTVNGRGLTYKIRITNQVRNLLKNPNAVNVKLGLVVTEDISISDFYKLKTANVYSSLVPRASVMNPLGTVLYGSNLNVPADKRLKLQIFYTKPN
jgi:hypothetical protein